MHHSPSRVSERQPHFRRGKVQLLQVLDETWNKHCSPVAWREICRIVESDGVAADFHLKSPPMGRPCLLVDSV